MSSRATGEKKDSGTKKKKRKKERVGWQKRTHVMKQLIPNERRQATASDSHCMETEIRNDPRRSTSCIKIMRGKQSGKLSLVD